MKARTIFVLWGAGVVVILLVAAGAYMALEFGRTNKSVSTVTYESTQVPLSFSYPSGWQVDSKSHAGDPSTTYYDLTFRSAKDSPTGEPEQATMTVMRWANPDNTPIEQAVRDASHDTQNLLVFAPCPFQNPNTLACSEISDQAAWINAGYLPVQAVVFFRVPDAIYVISWGQADTFDFQQDVSQDILRTLQPKTTP